MEDETLLDRVTGWFRINAPAAQVPDLAKLLPALTAQEAEHFFAAASVSPDFALGSFAGEARLAESPGAAILRYRQARSIADISPNLATKHPELHEKLRLGKAEPSDAPALALPSFGVRVPYFAPRRQVVDPVNGSTGDAYSSTPHRRDPELGLEDYLPGVVLELVTREEFVEPVDPGRLDRLQQLGVAGLLAPPLVRITDLRLARDLDRKELAEKLEDLLLELEQPVTLERVIRWRRRLSALPNTPEEARRVEGDAGASKGASLPSLRGEASDDAGGEALVPGGHRLPKPPDGRPGVDLESEPPPEPPVDDLPREPEGVDLVAKLFGSRAAGLTAVHFAAAALVLFLDLKMWVPRDGYYGDASSAREFSDVRVHESWMAERIARLSEALSKVLRTIDAAALTLRKQVRPRGPGRRATPAEDLLSLRAFCMGYGWEWIAERFGIHRYDYETAKGSGNPKGQAESHVRNGARLEKARHPRAAALLVQEQDVQTKLKALEAYRKYIEVTGEYDAKGEEELIIGDWRTSGRPERPRPPAVAAVPARPRDLEEEFRALKADLERIVRGEHFERGSPVYLLSPRFERDHPWFADDGPEAWGASRKRALKRDYGLLWSRVAAEVGLLVGTEENFEVMRAYALLGSVIVNNVDLSFLDK